MFPVPDEVHAAVVGRVAKKKMSGSTPAAGCIPIIKPALNSIGRMNANTLHALVTTLEDVITFVSMVVMATYPAAFFVKEGEKDLETDNDFVVDGLAVLLGDAVFDGVEEGDRDRERVVLGELLRDAVALALMLLEAVMLGESVAGFVPVAKAECVKVGETVGVTVIVPVVVNVWEKVLDAVLDAVTLLLLVSLGVSNAVADAEAVMLAVTVGDVVWLNDSVVVGVTVHVGVTEVEIVPAGVREGV
jgi:hypothetical protein